MTEFTEDFKRQSEELILLVLEAAATSDDNSYSYKGLREAGKLKNIGNHSTIHAALIKQGKCVRLGSKYHPLFDLNDVTEKFVSDFCTLTRKEKERVNKEEKAKRAADQILYDDYMEKKRLQAEEALKKFKAEEKKEEFTWDDLEEPVKSDTNGKEVLNETEHDAPKKPVKRTTTVRRNWLGIVVERKVEEKYD